MLADAPLPESQGRNPFPGLRAFEPDEDHLFFGRERQIDELLGRLRRTRFLGVVGTSGSGKSSLVRSGLIPSLYSGYMVGAGSTWRVAVMRPGPDPVGALARALNAPGVLGEQDLGPMGAEILETTLRRSALGLVETVRQARLPQGENLLVLVDQFEELFRFKREHRGEGGRDEAMTFVRLLLSAAEHSDAEGTPIYITLTMRSDFIGNCTELPGLAEAINDGQYLIPRMNRDERRAAIEGPVAVAGAEISPRLVRRLLNDVGDNPDQLPILQHALMRTWSFWEESRNPGEPLDLRHYEAVGQMGMALSNHADEAFAELDARGQHIAQVLFKALTDRDPEGRGLRRPTAVAEICALVERGTESAATVAEIEAVVDRFRRPGRTFLVASDEQLRPETVLDISHESLMRTWRKLIDWVQEEAQQAGVYLRLSLAAEQYYIGTGSAWRDPELQLALNWQRESAPTLAWAERYDPAFERAMAFLHHSETEQQREIAEREYQRQRQLRWTRRMAMVLGVGFLGAAALGLLALQQKMEAESARETVQIALDEAQLAKDKANAAKIEADEARTVAETEKERTEKEKQRAEQERERAEEEKRRAELEKRRADEARAKAETAERDADRQRLEAVNNAQAAARKEAEASRQRQRAERLRRQALAQAVATQVPTLLQQQSSRELGALLAVEAYQLNRQTGGEERDPEIFNALESAWLQLAAADDGGLGGGILHRFPDAVRALVLPSGRRVAIVGGDSGAIHRVDLAGGAVEMLGSVGSPVRALAVRGDDRQLAIGALDGSLYLWPLQGKGIEGDRRSATTGAAVTALAFLGDGALLSAHGDGSVRRWDASLTHEVLAPPQKHAATAVAVTADGRAVAVATAGAGLLYWPDLGSASNSQTAPQTLVPGREFHAVAFVPDVSGGGRRIAAGTGGQEVERIELWRPGAAEPELVFSGHASRITALDATADGHLLASTSLDGTVRLWQPDHPKVPPVVLENHSGWVWTGRFDPMGERLMSGGADRTVRSWIIDPAILARRICQQAGRALTHEEWSEYMNDLEMGETSACDQLGPRGARGTGGAR